MLASRESSIVESHLPDKEHAQAPLATEEYVVKSKIGKKHNRRRINKEAMARELIATRLYAACGVTVPKTYILKKQEKNEVIYKLASQRIPGYKDLFYHLGGISEIDKIDELEKAAKTRDPEKRAAKRNEHLARYKEKLDALKINNKERDLARFLTSAMFLKDYDAINRYFHNVGLVPDGHGYKLVKIDAGEVNFKGDFEINPTNPFILDDLVEIVNGSDYILGEYNRRFREIFQCVAGEEMLAERLAAIKLLIDISDEKLHEIIFDQEIIDEGLLTKEECSEIFETLKTRREAFRVAYADQLAKHPVPATENPSVLQTKTILDHKEFKKTKEQMLYGDSRPRVFTTKQHENLHHTENEEITSNKNNVLSSIRAYANTEKTWCHSRQETAKAILKKFITFNLPGDKIKMAQYLFEHYNVLLKQSPNGQLCKAIEVSLGKLLGLKLNTARTKQEKIDWITMRLPEMSQRAFREKPSPKDKVVEALHTFIHDTERSIGYKLNLFGQTKHLINALNYARDVADAIANNNALPKAPASYPSALKKIVEPFRNTYRPKPEASVGYEKG